MDRVDRVEIMRVERVNVKWRNSVTHVMIYAGRITNISLLYLQFSTEGWVVRLQSSDVVCFRPLLLWDITQHWLSVNLEE